MVLPCWSCPIPPRPRFGGAIPFEGASAELEWMGGGFFFTLAIHNKDAN